MYQGKLSAECEHVLFTSRVHGSHMGGRACVCVCVRDVYDRASTPAGIRLFVEEEAE